MPQARRRRPWGPLAGGLVAGLVVAAIIGGILAAAGVLHIGSTRNEPASVSADPITLPATMPGFQDFSAANQARVNSTRSTSGTKAASILGRMRDNNEKVVSLTKAAYEKANPGAAVAVRRYSDAELERQISVIAIRATYPELTNGPVLDPAYLQLAVAPQHIESFGNVQCLLSAQVNTPAGNEPDPDDLFTLICQRSGPALTVQLYAGGGFDGAESQKIMIDLTNSTFTGLAG